MVQVMEIINYWNLQPYYFSLYCTEPTSSLMIFSWCVGCETKYQCCCIGAVWRQEEFLLHHSGMWSETWEKMIEREKDRNWGNIECWNLSTTKWLSYGCTSKNSIKFSLNTANGKMEKGWNNRNVFVCIKQKT